MSSSSSFQAGSRSRKKKVVRCGCGDVCNLAVARTPDNNGRKFYGCPNYQVEGEDCGFFKWYNEEEDGQIKNHQIKNQQMKNQQMKNYPSYIEQGQGQMKALVEVIIGLLFLIFVMLTIVVLKM